MFCLDDRYEGKWHFFHVPEGSAVTRGGEKSRKQEEEEENKNTKKLKIVSLTLQLYLQRVQAATSG
jgi:hypothetical protein